MYLYKAQKLNLYYELILAYFLNYNLCYIISCKGDSWGGEGEGWSPSLVFDIALRGRA